MEGANQGGTAEAEEALSLLITAVVSRDKGFFLMNVTPGPGNGEGFRINMA